VGAFGEKLRKQREQRNIALDAISNTTKISTRMLRALEDEHFDQLPGGVFNKGFVRAYARQVGLDEEEAIADYLAALRESQIQAQSILPDFRDLNHNPRGHDLKGTDLRSNDLDGADVRGNDLHSNDLRGDDARKASLPASNAADRGNQLLRDDRRKQGRRNEDRHDAPPHEGRKESRSQKGVPSALDSAADTPAERFRQRYPAGIPGQPTTQPSTQIPWGKLAVALLCLTLVLALWSSRRHAEPTAAAQPVAASTQPPVPPSVSAPALPATQRPASATSLKGGKASPAESLTLSSGKIPLATILPAPTSSSATSTLALPAAPVPQPSLKAAPATASQADPTTRPATNPAGTTASAAKLPAAAIIPLKTFTLLIRAEKTTWVSIAADGKPVAEETLIAPAHTSVRAAGEVVVKAGNAAGVSFQLNGKDIAAEGNEGEVKTYVFDATGLRPSPPAQSPDTNR
jgi:cytoskeletal protein RodZ